MFTVRGYESLGQFANVEIACILAESRREVLVESGPNYSAPYWMRHAVERSVWVEFGSDKYPTGRTVTV